MPEIVKICYNSIIRNSGGHKVVLITKYNYVNYLGEMPYINELVNCLNNDKFTITSFSDIIRCYLLYTYGGLWCDATILLTKDINDVVKDNNFVSCMKKNENKKITNYLDCSAFFMYSSKGNPGFKFVYEILTKHTLAYGAFSCYFMINYLILIAYENLEYACSAIESSPIFPNKVHYLCRAVLTHENKLNNKFSQKRWDNLIDKNPFLKLTYKLNEILLETTSSKMLSYYGYIKHHFLLQCK